MMFLAKMRSEDSVYRIWKRMVFGLTKNYMWEVKFMKYILS